jgi:hypothetical protein
LIASYKLIVTQLERREMDTKVCSENLKEINLLDYVGIDGMIILKRNAS